MRSRTHPRATQCRTFYLLLNRITELQRMNLLRLVVNERRSLTWAYPTPVDWVGSCFYSSLVGHKIQITRQFQSFLKQVIKWGSHIIFPFPILEVRCSNLIKWDSASLGYWFSFLETREDQMVIQGK